MRRMPFLWTWMGRTPWFFPLPLTLATLALTWGCAVLIDELVSGLQWATTAILLVLLVLVVLNVVMFIRLNFVQVVKPRALGWGFLDSYLSMLHALAGLMMAVAAVSTPTGYHFAGIPDGTRGYALYWIYCIQDTVTYFHTVGASNVRGVTALGALWVVLTVITGVAFIAFFLVIVLRTLKTAHAREKQAEGAQQSRLPSWVTAKEYPPRVNNRKVRPPLMRGNVMHGVKE